MRFWTKIISLAVVSLLGPVSGANAAYVEGNPMNHIDPEGLDVVVVTGGRRETRNPFGHTAVGVSGVGIYSYGNNTLLGSSPLDYVETQARFRDQQITIIPRTQFQDKAAFENLMGNGCKNCVGILDNCAVRTDTALRSAGVSTNLSPLPGGVARDAMRAPGAVNYYIPKGSPIPAAIVDALKPFNPPNVP